MTNELYWEAQWLIGKMERRRYNPFIPFTAIDVDTLDFLLSLKR